MTATTMRWACGPIPTSAVAENGSGVDASGERTAQIICAPAGDTITHVWFKYISSTGTPPTYRVSLQALNASGEPDGTVLGGGSPASATFTPPAGATWNNTGRWIALSNAIALSPGVLYAVVIDYSSGTVDASNFSNFGQSLDPILSRSGVGYSAFYNGSAWSKSTGGWTAFKSATRVYGFPIVNRTTAAASTNGHRAAAKITVPTSWCSTYQVRGLNFRATGPASADWKIGIWNAAGTMIQEATFDADAQTSPGNTQRSHELYFDESPLTDLTAGTAYYFGPERTTQTVELEYWSLAEANDRTNFPFGTGAAISTWNGSAWSDTTAALPMVELILADIVQPAGGGTGGINRLRGKIG